jgi:hypothetical protein
MLRKGKRHKGKEMGAQECNKAVQIHCLERDTGGEERVKKGSGQNLWI